MKITRRDIVRRLGGISVVGALAAWFRWVTRPEPDLLYADVRNLDGSTSRVAGTRVSSTRAVVAAPAPPATSRDGSAASAPAPASAPSSTVASGENTTPSTTAPTDDRSTSTTNPPATTPSTRAQPSSPTTAAQTSQTTPSATSPAPRPPSGGTELAGSLGATLVPAGSTYRIVGDIELQGDLVVEGVLTGVDTFRLSGNGHQIEVRKGGRLDLRGKPKTGWTRGSPSGWQRGDRVGTIPTARGRYGVGDISIGRWPLGRASSVRLLDGRGLRGEQFNLTRSITIQGVSRILFHSSAGIQVLKHVAVVDGGITGKLGFYPVHFHKNYGSTRGSIVEGVVVEGGRNHAFVPHASHGITMVDCVAYNITDDAFWWDPPGSGTSARERFDTTNNSNNTVWQHCLVAGVRPRPGEPGYTLTGFFLSAGSGNRCVDSAAAAVGGGKNASGFHWPSQANKNDGGNVWTFDRNVAHNNAANGIFVWQNDPGSHLVKNFVAYRCGISGINHGAYGNNYRYQSVVVQEAGQAAVQSHSVGRSGDQVFSAVTTDGKLVIRRHNLPAETAVIHEGCTYTRVVVSEEKKEPSIQEFRDCRLTPDSFDVSGARPGTVIRVFEGGALRWTWNGKWTTR